MYREEILEHWKNPLNFGEIEGADLVVEQVNPLCGDEVRFFFKFNKKQETRNKKHNKNDEQLTISEVRFVGNGCAISVATSSMLSEHIKGKSVKAISKLVGQDVLEMIGGNVAPARLKCAFLPLEVTRKLSTKDEGLTANAKTEKGFRR